MIDSGRALCVPRLRAADRGGPDSPPAPEPFPPVSLSEGRETAVRFWRGARTEVREFDARR